jgi:hypothetical protein
MQRKPWRHSNRQRQTIGTNIMTLEQTVKDVQASLANGNYADNAAVETNSVLDSLRNENVLLQHQLDDLKLKLEALTSAQPVTVAATAKLECSIQYDVKAPEMARWRNDGWEVKHYQFVDNDRSVPTLAVVMERPAEIKPELFRRDEESIRPEAPAPLNFADTQKVEIVFADELDEIIIEEEPVIVPEFVPSMDVPIVVPVLEPALATPDFAKALRNPHATVDDVIAVGNEAILNAGRAVYNALQPTIEKYVEQPIEVIHG